MKRLQLLTVGELDGTVMEGLAVELANHFGMPCEVLPETIDPQFSFHGERRQYHSSQILAQMSKFVGPKTWRLLAVSGNDLYIPILTFVFGEAQMGGPSAIVSYYRLRQQFYGLPHDPDLLRQRLLKEAVHELGHTLELTHCDDYRCAMSASHSVELIDLKENAFCEGCANQVLSLTRAER
ncbi:MAG TPA: archaemetzincin family Zn-dependent metalloprotease [Terriglobales bacterium]|nr:archaemetzincin family Zn-dependent metalloprotease [Terriglobales bacterium]